MNIVYIVIDELGYYELSCMGHSHFHTPNIDRLATQGVRFTNALAPELARSNIACVAIDPGFTRTELVDLLGERGVVDPAAAHSMDLPVSRVVEVITADEPRRYAGQILRMIK